MNVGAGPCACPMCCPRACPNKNGQPRGMGNHGGLPLHNNGKNMNKNRQSIRLRGYDYSQSGAYFVTICTQNKKCFFGNIINEEMVLNDSGRMIKMIWDELPINYPGINIDEFQIMPNHVHGIIIIDKGAAGLSLPDIVHRFKSLTTARYIRGVKQKQWPPFPGKLWQRNYYEHIVRDENELNDIRKYIMDNPKKWDLDRENPNAW